MWTTGIRRNEARMVDLRDLGHHQGELLVRAGKGGKARVVPLIPRPAAP